MDNLRGEIRAAFARQQAALGDAAQAKDRLLGHALANRAHRNGLVRVAGAAATVVVAAAIAVAVLLTHGHLRQTPAVPATVEEALTSGPAAALPSQSNHAFVWLTGYLIQPQSSSGGRVNGVTGVTVAVMDWTGRVRYHFNVPASAGASVPNQIQSISADGTRGLLDDGTVIDQTGKVVGRLAGLKVTGMPANATRWMADDQHVCASFSNEPVAEYPATHPKGAPNATPTPAQPYTLPGADHSVTLKIFGLDGTVRSIATVGAGSLGVPSGPFGDSTSVVSCSATNDLAVVARYHDADVSSSQSSTNMTVSLWAIKLSTGSVLYHQPETRMALGRAFFFGSENGQLAVEFLWNSRVAGSETDVVLHLPSGQQVPVVDAEPIPDTPGLSADGTRILRRLADPTHGQTVLELIDASNGKIIRRVVIPASVGASAVAEPGGSGFLVQVDKYFAFVDGSGGITLLHPDVNAGRNGPGGVGLSGTYLQN